MSKLQIIRGWGKVADLGSKPFDRKAAYRDAQRSANRGDRGIWGRCGGMLHKTIAWRITDPRDSVHAIDVFSSTLSVEKRGRFRITLDGFDFESGRLDAVEVYLDTHRFNVGPEYGFQRIFDPAAEGQVSKGAWRITNWNDSGDRQPCPRWFANPDYRADAVLISIPTRCVGDLREVRWNIRTWNITRYNPDGGWRGFADAAPGWNTFRGSPWAG